MLLLASIMTPPNEIRRATEEVLSRPEFQPPADPNWLEKLLNWIGDLFNRLGSWANDNPVGAWIVVGVLLLALAAIVFHIVYTFRQVFGTDQRDDSRSEKAASPFEVLEGAAGDYRTGIRLALEALGRGDMRQAVWIGHRVLLGLLDQQGALAFAAWKTNIVYLAECTKHAGDSRALLERLSSDYDEVVYAHRPGDVGGIGQRLEAVARMMDRPAARTRGQ